MVYIRPLDRMAQPGVITDALRFHVDLNNQSSWDPNQLTTWLDTIASVSGAVTAGTITNGHLNFGTGFTTDVDFGVLPTALENIFTAGGTALVWVRIESGGSSTEGRIIDTKNLSVDGWSWYVLNEVTALNVIDVGFRFGADATDNRWETTLTIPTGEWVMLAITFNSTTPTIAPAMYVNGGPVAVTTIANGSTVPNSDAGKTLHVGNRAAADTLFDGDIDFVGLYDTTKTAAEILDLYQRTRSRFQSTGIAQSGVIVEDLAFFIDANNQSSWTPRQATKWDDTVLGTSGVVTGAIKIDGHLNFFDGSATSYVDFGIVPDAVENLFQAPGGGGYSAWIRAESDGEGSEGRIYSTGSTDFYVAGESAGFVKLRLLVDLSINDANYETTVAGVEIGEWTHVAVMWTEPAGDAIFYINGVAVADTVIGGGPSGTFQSDAGTDLVVGNDSVGGSLSFDGDIEMLAVYNRLKTASEVADIYNATKARFGIDIDTDTHLRSAQPGVFTEEAAFHIDFNNADSWEPNQLTTWVDTVNGAVGTASGFAASTMITDGHLLFDPATGPSTPSVDFGAPIGGMINPFGPTPTAGGSFNMWIRCNGAVTANRVMNTGSGVGFQIFAFNEAAGLYRIRFDHTGTSGTKFMGSDVAFPIGEWVNIGYSWNGLFSATTQYKWYMNGEVMTNAPGSVIAGGPLDGDDVWVGSLVTGGSNFDGNIEMLTIFDEEQSASVHRDIYNATKDRFGPVGPVAFPSYTITPDTTPDATLYTGAMIYVSDETGGAIPAFSDGTNWRRVSDRAIIA